MAYDVDLTGPPYPSLPGPGSNAIGRFAIGASTIGDIPPFDWRATVISQYSNSPRIIALIETFFANLDQTQNLDAFYDNIMNLDTAQGHGLDLWGRIVGVNRVLQVADVSYFGFAEALPGSLGFNDSGQAGYETAFGFSNAGPASFQTAFGFAEAGDTAPFSQGTFGLHKQFLQAAETNDYAPFDQGTFGLHKTFAQTGQSVGGAFYTGQTLTSAYALSDDTYRTLIFAKAAANITSGSIQAINRLLMTVFPNQGNAYVTDGIKVSSYFGFAEAGNALGFNDAGPATMETPFGFAEAGDCNPLNQGTFGLHKEYLQTGNTTGGPFYTGETIPRMTMQYTFEFPLTPVEIAIVEQSGVLPKPTGVLATTVIEGYR